MNDRVFAKCLIAVLTAASLASFTEARAGGIQMLPPTDFSGNACTGATGGLLQWDGATSMKCVPGTAGNSAGYVGIGIGTASPGSPLQIGADLAFTNNPPAIGFNMNPNTTTYLTTNSASEIQQDYTNGGLGFWVAPSGTAGSSVFSKKETLFVGSNGYIGIGSTSPISKLNIVNDSSTVDALDIVSNSNVIGSTNYGMRLDMSAGQVNQANTGLSIYQSGIYSGSDGSATGLNISVNSRNTTYGVYAAATKNWSGNDLLGSAVGIYGSGTTDSPWGYSYGGYFENLATAGTGYGVYIHTTTGAGTVTPLLVANGSTSLLQVNSNGNVAITSTLSFNIPTGDIIAERASISYVGDAEDWAGALVFSTEYDGNPPSERMRINQNGNVGIGNPNPSYVLDVTGQARFTGNYTTSDRRLKTNIMDIGYGLADVMRLHPVFFDWKKPVKGEEGRRVGFIAQEVEQVIPEVVSTAPDAMKTKAVEYGNVTPVLVKAVQQIKALFDADHDALMVDHEALARLKADNDKLRARVATLEAKSKQQ